MMKTMKEFRFSRTYRVFIADGKIWADDLCGNEPIEDNMDFVYLCRQVLQDFNFYDQARGEEGFLITIETRLAL